MLVRMHGAPVPNTHEGGRILGQENIDDSQKNFCTGLSAEDARIRPVTALHVLERVFHVMTDGRLLNPLLASLMGGGGTDAAADAGEGPPPPRALVCSPASGVLTSPFACSEHPSLWVRLPAQPLCDTGSYWSAQVCFMRQVSLIHCDPVHAYLPACRMVAAQTRNDTHVVIS